MLGSALPCPEHCNISTSVRPSREPADISLYLLISGVFVSQYFSWHLAQSVSGAPGSPHSFVWRRIHSRGPPRHQVTERSVLFPFTCAEWNNSRFIVHFEDVIWAVSLFILFWYYNNIQQCQLIPILFQSTNDFHFFARIWMRSSMPVFKYSISLEELYLQISIVKFRCRYFSISLQNTFFSGNF